ncbi:ATP-binding protein [Paucibacter sp. AS339]|uniref:sensor histidine kinase n=1 Tax=Paucibacter hankyongi TaxID=3133434 RepID=UPI0030A2399C
MDSRPRLRPWLALLGLALMAGGAGVAGWQHESPRLAVLALLPAMAGFVMAWRWGRRVQAQIAVEAQPGPSFQTGVDQLARQQMLELESRLEHAPVALWQLQGQGAVQALNNAARRLLAPGGARDRADLLARIAAQAPAAGDGSGQHSLFSYESERGIERCLLASRELVLQQQSVRLLALMPIESELEAETLKAWRQLVHVLTHEIMNSLTPISSLSRTALELLAEAEVPAEQRQDLTLAMDTIARRADALARFVGNYRRVSELPEPKIEPVLLSELFARLEQLVAADWRARGGEAQFELDSPSLSLMADAGQLEQALLNLIKNAAQACADQAQPNLLVRARLVRGGRLSLEVRDNGPGVPAGMENDIFLPFVSTKPSSLQDKAAGGQGIGLAVVRNLVHGMGGSVRYVKPVSGGACFVLTF